ncbi:hypothetical protein GCM10027346_07530 [Hymenobacter seoulensis]
MAARLASHPFAVEAVLARTTVLTFAAPVASLQPLIPESLTLDTLDSTWGFVAVALVQTNSLRPQGLPTWMGRNFFLIGYRVFVRYTTQRGKRLRGLYILKSETDKPQMQWLGNLFTSYHYVTVDIQQTSTEKDWAINSQKAKLAIEVSSVMPEPLLPAGSPFSSWQQARRFAGPLPFTFSYDAASQYVTIVEGTREDWHPRPLQVQQAQVGFLDELNLAGLQLASAFATENVPYCWKKGRAERWIR